MGRNWDAEEAILWAKAKAAFEAFRRSAPQPNQASPEATAAKQAYHKAKADLDAFMDERRRQHS